MPARKIAKHFARKYTAAQRTGTRNRRGGHDGFAGDAGTQMVQARRVERDHLICVAGAMRVLRADGLLYCFGQLGKREHTFLHLMSEAARRWQFHDLITWDGIGHARFRQLRLPQL